MFHHQRATCDRRGCGAWTTLLAGDTATDYYPFDSECEWSTVTVIGVRFDACSPQHAMDVIKVANTALDSLRDETADREYHVDALRGRMAELVGRDVPEAHPALIALADAARRAHTLLRNTHTDGDPEWTDTALALDAALHAARKVGVESTVPF